MVAKICFNQHALNREFLYSFIVKRFIRCSTISIALSRQKFDEYGWRTIICDKLSGIEAVNHHSCFSSFAKHSAFNSNTIQRVVQSLSCVWLCDPMTCSMPDFPVLHCLLEFAQTLVHWVGDAIQQVDFPKSSSSSYVLHPHSNCA